MVRTLVKTLCRFCRERTTNHCINATTLRGKQTSMTSVAVPVVGEQSASGCNHVTAGTSANAGTDHPHDWEDPFSSSESHESPDPRRSISLPSPSSSGNHGRSLLENRSERGSGTAGKQGIDLRSCSWGKTSMLMFTTYVGPAVMTFPSAFSELGAFWGVLMVMLNAMAYYYTSMVLWRMCMKYPEVKDICDIAGKVLGCWAYWMTAVVFVSHCVVSTRGLFLPPSDRITC